MALPLIPSDAGLLLLQAGMVAAPRALGPIWQRRLDRLRRPAWALIPALSIVVVIFAIRYASGTASGLTYLALVAVPLLAALALGALAHGSRWWLAPVAGALFVVAWRTPASLAGEAAAALLTGLSCITLGVLLSAVTPARWLKLGVVAMACVDVFLIASNQLQAPNTVLATAAPGAGLPQLQSEQFGTVSLGYGDLFVAALLGAMLAAQRRPQLWAAALTLVIAALFDLLFLVVDDLPATVPVAIALIALESWSWLGRRRLLRVSARYGPSRQADAIPPPAT